MARTAASEPKPAQAVPARQRLRWAAAVATAIWSLAALADPLAAQLYDGLDAYPPRWFLWRSDCGAELTRHAHLASGGIDGRGCETLTVAAGRGGSEAILVYPIEPVRPLDDLTANLAVMSARPGIRVGLRVRFPYLEDPETRQPVAVIVYGAGYERPGEFVSLGIGMIERPLRMRKIALRQEHGLESDLSDPYVDAVIVNAYGGPGETSLRLDELRVEGMVPVGKAAASAGAAWVGTELDTPRGNRSLLRMTASPEDGASGTGRRAFPVGHMTRILQHNGEPLEWVRMLGFDAVLLPRPPDSAILREAISARVLIYAPPPSAPSAELEPLLEPVAGWYLGSGVPLDRQQVEAIERQSRELRRWPRRWRRPLVGSPLESHREYSLSLDAVIDEAPPRVRGLTAAEEIAELRETRRRLGEAVQQGIGIASMPPEALVRQTDAIAAAIGAPPLSHFRWHAMWVQCLRLMETTPGAILFRSTRSLASGSPMDSHRAMALSYVNRMVAAIEPWVAGAAVVPPPGISGGTYRCCRMASGDADLLVLTTTASRGSEILSGDGQAIEVQLSPQDAAKTFWRLTHFSAERVMPEIDQNGSRLEIVSPDAVELLLMSDDPSVGGRAATLAGRFARQAGLDRWQLTTDAVARTRQEWSLAAAAGISPQDGPIELAAVATRTLRDAEPLFRAGDFGASLRMARRADAWGLRSRWRLAETLMPDWPNPTSCPPIDCGAAEVQANWFPLMSDAGWGSNRLNSGGLDDPQWLEEGRWKFGRRLVGRAESMVTFTRRGAFSGSGALRARVVPGTEDGLPGGYEGTTIQIRSPSVRVEAGSAVRIDAMIRTVGFGRPHQGVLIYDSIGGQEAGVLVRGRPSWTPVRLYRQAAQPTEVEVMFELIGGGEATIDQVELRLWEPQSAITPPLRPMRTDEFAGAAGEPAAADAQTARLPRVDSGAIGTQ